jgi:hypothetical protein
MKYLSVLLSSIVLVACGGGGGGSAPAPGPVASTSTFLLKQAYANDFNDTLPYSYAISGTISGANIAGNGTTTQSAVSNTTFESVAALQKSRTSSGNVVATGPGGTVNIPLAPTTETLFLSPTFNLLGYTGSSAYTVAAAPVLIPTTAMVGNSGTIGNFNSYATSAKLGVPATNVVTWALEADTATTALMKLTQTLRSSTGVLTATQVDTFRITPAGGVTRISQSANIIGTGTLTLTY